MYSYVLVTDLYHSINLKLLLLLLLFIIIIIIIIIAQLAEHDTGIAEATGSNPVEALIFFRLLLSNCLSWKIYCDNHSSLSSTTAVQTWIISYILHIISLLISLLTPQASSFQLLKLENLLR